MMRQMKNLLYTFSLALCIASTAFGQGGTYTTIDFPGASSTIAWSINKSGDTVGTYTIGAVTHGFKLTAGRFTTIDYPGATNTGFRGINNRGDISGIYRNADGLAHAFLFSDGEFTSLDVPQSTYINSTALTAHGNVIGRYMAGTVASGYLLREGVYSTIAFPGATFTGSASMNKRGDIVGRYRTADSTTAFHAFLLSGFQSGCVAYVPRVAISSGGAAVTHASDFTLVTAANPARQESYCRCSRRASAPLFPEWIPGSHFLQGRRRSSLHRSK